jgi:Protein of unknown function (DUF1643)
LSSGAIFDLTNRYRYVLWRTWDRHAPVVTFVMLNPSAADAGNDDPTIRRCVAFARGWGFGGVLVVNLVGCRTAQPVALREASDPSGPDNEYFCGTLVEAPMWLSRPGATMALGCAPLPIWQSFFPTRLTVLALRDLVSRAIRFM